MLVSRNVGTDSLRLCGRTFLGALALVQALPFEGWLEASRGGPCSGYIGFLLDPRLALGGLVVVETMSLLNTLLCLRFPLAVQV